jgi:NAD(P)-dependent dehydrogenase (short-subunit alcohol dehydrogenase family)
MSLPRLPTMRLDGKRALVTGAGRGIGLAAAAALAQVGADVTLAARSAAEIEEVARMIRDEGGTATALVLDVTDLAALDAVFSDAEPFDVLVNNAGTNRPAHFLDVRMEDFDEVIRLNLRANFAVAQRVARGMRAAGRGGSIIQMSSQMGHVGGANRTVYCASKHAIEGLTKAMAIDLGPHGIRVNTICPTYIETPLTRPFFKDTNFSNEVIRRIKLGRIGQIEDIMGAVVFLASEASALTTGSALMVDGGWTAE